MDLEQMVQRASKEELARLVLSYSRGDGGFRAAALTMLSRPDDNKLKNYKEAVKSQIAALGDRGHLDWEGAVRVQSTLQWALEAAGRKAQAGDLDAAHDLLAYALPAAYDVYMNSDDDGDYGYTVDEAAKAVLTFAKAAADGPGHQRLLVAEAY